MTVRVYNRQGHEIVAYPEGVKAVRDESGVLQVFRDNEKTKCIALHNVNSWAYVTVKDDDE